MTIEDPGVVTTSYGESQSITKKVPKVQYETSRVIPNFVRQIFVGLNVYIDITC